MRVRDPRSHMITRRRKKNLLPKPVAARIGHAMTTRRVLDPTLYSLAIIQETSMEALLT